MPLAHRSYADARVLKPTGRLDHDNYEAFRADLATHEAACAREQQTLVLDLSGLEWQSSACGRPRDAIPATTATTSNTLADWRRMQRPSTRAVR